MRTRIIDTIWREIQLKEVFNIDNNKVYNDVYSGDNFDNYCRSIDCDINSYLDIIENEMKYFML